MAERIVLDNESDTAGGGGEVIGGDRRRVREETQSQSPYWEHYKLVSDPSTGITTAAICTYCRKVTILHNPDHPTTLLSLKIHLRKCPTYPLNLDRQQKKQKLISAYNNDNNSNDNDKSDSLGSVSMPSNLEEFDQDMISLAIARMIIVDGERFSRVDDEGLRYFMSVVRPQFVMPSRFDVVKDVKKLYICHRAELRSLFDGLRSRVALATDCWSSEQGLDYVCLTAHFVDNDWKLQKRVIGFQLVDKSKGKEVGRVVKRCVMDWGIEKKLSCLTVDNASSSDDAVDHLVGALKDDLILKGRYFHMRCAGHVINWLVKDGLEMVESSLVKIRSVVRYVRSSLARTKLFKECAAKAEVVQCKGGICLDVSTQWDTTYLMLERALKYEKAFDLYANDDKEFKADMEAMPVDEGGIPTPQDWENAKRLALILKQLYESTNGMSGNLYTTSNRHFHEILAILAGPPLLWEGGDPNSKLGTMGEKMKKKFDEYYGEWGHTNLMIILGVVFDPRYKLRFVKAALSNLNPNQSEAVDRHLDGVLKELYGVYASSSFLGRACGAPSGTSASKESNEYVSKIYKDFRAQEALLSVERRPELDLYLAEPVVKEDQFDILKWWNKQSANYPVLAAMARDILAVPVSTVSSESAFCTSGGVLDQFRSSLGPKTVEVLVCAQDWLRGGHISLEIEQYLDDIEQYEEELENNIPEVDAFMSEN